MRTVQSPGDSPSELPLLADGKTTSLAALPRLITTAKSVIQALEHDLGVPLLDRRSGTVTVTATPFGELVH